MVLKILAVGDIIGETGIKELKNKLHQIRQKEEIDFVIEQLKRIVGRLREMSPLYEDFVKKHR